jgi:uncharacterized membrane-anchored protein
MITASTDRLEEDEVCDEDILMILDRKMRKILIRQKKSYS